jgi:hypothetical protein
MQRDKTKSQGKKTHEQFLRTVERKEGVPKPGEVAELKGEDPAASQVMRDAGARQSEMPVSRRGMNQESRDHNKHNNPGQSGHKPQKHSPAEEKH